MATDVQSAVELTAVSVRYGSAYALRDVTATLPYGAVGLLGPNGAGKSTLLRALLGFVAPDAGDMRVLGLDVRRSALTIRGRIGYMPENDAHIPGMSAVGFVAYCGELAGLPTSAATERAHEVLYYVGLGEARYRNIETYSAGMKQRIKLAQALVHDPDLLFLDEPTNGMDPKGRDEMLALIGDIASRKGLSLILSSHLLPDVEHVCRHVIVLDRGRVAAEGSIDVLKGHGERVFEVRVKGETSRFAEALQRSGIGCDASGETFMRVYLPAGREPQEIFQLASASAVQVRHLRPRVPSLEDVFVRALGKVGGR